MKAIAAILLGMTLSASLLAQTTNTDCSSQKVGNTTNTNCQSTTTPPPTTSNTDEETGQQIGQGIGNRGNALAFRIRSSRELKQAKKHCAERPGFEHGYKFSDGEIALCENGVPTPEVTALQDYCKLHPDTVGPTVPDGPYTCLGSLLVHVPAK
jgi:hypothetical protein